MKIMYFPFYLAFYARFSVFETSVEMNKKVPLRDSWDFNPSLSSLSPDKVYDEYFFLTRKK